MVSESLDFKPKIEDTIENLLAFLFMHNLLKNGGRDLECG
jgi:hypothetical protein